MFRSVTGVKSLLLLGDCREEEGGAVHCEGQHGDGASARRERDSQTQRSRVVSANVVEARRRSIAARIDASRENGREGRCLAS
jgi:hypothetical protein